MTSFKTKTYPLSVILIQVIIFLGLQLQLAYSSTVAINSTYERDILDLTAEEFEAANVAENAAFDELDMILMSIQTLEGLDEFEKCGYLTETNPYKVLDCYEKNKDKIK